MNSEVGGAGGMGPIPSASGGADSPGGAGNIEDAGSNGGTTDLDAATDIDLPALDAGDAGDAGDAATARDASVSPTDASTDETSPDEDAATPPEVDASSEEDAAVVDSGVDPEPADGAAEVSCSWVGASASTYYFSVNLLLTNSGDEALDLRDVELLYYFSSDGREATQSVVVNDSPIADTDAEIDSTGASPPAGADHYALVSFADCTSGCTLAAGASLSRAVQIGLASGGAGPFNATNDYSYTPADDDPCEFVVVLQNSTRIFGTPPN